MRYWRVTFTEAGTVADVVELAGQGSAEWVVVEAETVEEAHRKAVRAYSARKVRERRAQLKAEGRCKCSRVLDRPGFSTCGVCEELRARSRAKRKAEGFRPIPRDEAARVASFQQRSRDRKAEMRLEVLIEVRRWWREAPHTQAFAERLLRELQSCGVADAKTADGVVSSGRDLETQDTAGESESTAAA